MPHIAIYCRISKDRTGRLEGVDAQERWGRQYAAERWPELGVAVYSDNDLSAANGDHRPGYEALRQAIRDGQVQHLWCVEQSRLERTETGWFTLAAELDAAGITELHTNRDGIVRVRDEVAGIKAVLAAAEVRKLKRRLNDRLDENAARGQPSGGRTFGYTRDVTSDGAKTLAVDDGQARWVRWAADRLTAGWSLSNVAAHLNNAGVEGALGGRWEATSVRKMVTNHTVAGYRVHRGEVVGDGNWPPILPRDVWRNVCATLGQTRTITSADGGTYTVQPTRHRRARGRRYLLTGQAGVGRCATCGGHLNGTVKQQRGGDARYYYCAERWHVAIRVEPVEEHVRDLLAAELDKPALADALAADEHEARRRAIHDRLERIAGRRGDLAAMWGAGDITQDEWQAARGQLDGDHDRLHQELADVPPPPVGFDAQIIREGWDAMTLDERRQIVAMFVDRVTIRPPAKPGARTFDAGRVAVEWRHTR